MRFDREHLIFKAICALDEIVDIAREEPVRGTLAVRFVLAYLYSQSETNDRKAFDEFWKIIGDPYDSAFSEHDRRYIRTTYARGCLTKIARSCGVTLDIVTVERIGAVKAKTRAPKGPASPGWMRRADH